MKIPRWLVKLLRPVVREVVAEVREEADERGRELAKRLRREMESSRTATTPPNAVAFISRKPPPDTP